MGWVLKCIAIREKKIVSSLSFYLFKAFDVDMFVACYEIVASIIILVPTPATPTPTIIIIIMPALVAKTKFN